LLDLKRRRLELLQTSALWTPLPGPQTSAFESEADVIGYGGAAGGGKSDLTIGMAITQHSRSVIFRREGVQARDLYERAKAIAIQSGGRFNDTMLLCRDLPGNRTLEFAGVKDADDVQKWRGRPHDFIGFDEATEFLESQVRFLSGWLRTTVPGQRTRVVLTFNPPSSADGRWVIRFFAPWLDRTHPNPALPGELRWFAMVGGSEIECVSGEAFQHGGETITSTSRTFIPARLKENPFLSESDYGRQLQSLPEPHRSQLLYGDFDAGVEDDAWQVIPTGWIEAAQARWVPGGHRGPVSAWGVDVARGGKDRTVFVPRYGNWFGEPIVRSGAETPDGLAVVGIMATLPEAGAAPFQIDVIGVGSSAYDIASGNGYSVIAMNGSERSDATDKSGKLRFMNKRAEWIWKLREALDPTSGEDLALPPDPEILADLTAPRWKQITRGIQIESKDDIKARIGRSPDKGDAICYAHAQNNPAGWNVVGFYGDIARQHGA
jgi:hypothetical protein